MRFFCCQVYYASSIMYIKAHDIAIWCLVCAAHKYDSHTLWLCYPLTLLHDVNNIKDALRLITFSSIYDYTLYLIQPCQIYPPVIVSRIIKI